MNTGIYIRAKIEHRWENIDIGDRRLPADELLKWLASLPNEGVVRTIEHVRSAIQESGHGEV